MGRWLDVTLAPTFVRTFQEDPDGLDRLVPFAEMPTEGAIIMAKGLPFDLSVEDVSRFVTTFSSCFFSSFFPREGMEALVFFWAEVGYLM